MKISASKNHELIRSVALSVAIILSKHDKRDHSGFDRNLALKQGVPKSALIASRRALVVK